MRGKARFFSVLLMGVGILFLFAPLSNQALASGSNPIQVNWDKPHYFVGGQTNPCHVEYKYTAYDYPTAKVTFWYAGEQIVTDWEIHSCAAFGGATSQSHTTRSNIKIHVKLWDPNGKYEGEQTWDQKLNFGDNSFKVWKGNTVFRINFHYPQVKPGDSVANVYIKR